MFTYRGVNVCLNVQALVGAFNQEKALAGAFSVIMNLRVDLRLQLQYQVSPGGGQGDPGNLLTRGQQGSAEVKLPPLSHTTATPATMETS